MNKCVKMSLVLLVAGACALQAGEEAIVMRVDFDNHPAVQRALPKDPVAKEPITGEELLAYHRDQIRSFLKRDLSNGSNLSDQELQFLNHVSTQEQADLDHYNLKVDYQTNLLSPQERIAIVKAVEGERAAQEVRSEYSSEELKKQEEEQTQAYLAREYGVDSGTTSQEIRLAREQAARKAAEAAVEMAARKKYSEFYTDGPSYH